jgi:hypothetical protein
MPKNIWRATRQRIAAEHRSHCDTVATVNARPELPELAHTGRFSMLSSGKDVARNSHTLYRCAPRWHNPYQWFSSLTYFTLLASLWVEAAWAKRPAKLSGGVDEPRASLRDVTHLASCRNLSS